MPVLIRFARCALARQAGLRPCCRKRRPARIWPWRRKSGMRRLIIGMTGSTGAIFGVRMLEALKASEIEMPSHHQQMGAAHARARDPLHRRAGEGARQCGAQPGRHGRVDLVGLVQDRRHGGDSLLGAHAGRHLQRLRRAPGASRRRRHPQGAPPTGAGGARDAAIGGAPREHAQARAHGGLDRAADAGLLQPSADRRRHRQSHRRARARPVRHCRRRSPSAGTATCRPRPRSPRLGPRRRRAGPEHPRVPDERALRERRSGTHRRHDVAYFSP